MGRDGTHIRTHTRTHTDTQHSLCGDRNITLVSDSISNLLSPVIYLDKRGSRLTTVERVCATIEREIQSIAHRPLRSRNKN